MKKQPTEVRQEQIKKAVLDIIATEGFQKLSTRNLANRVGISEGALFRHFKSKKDILLAIMQDVRSRLVRKLQDIALADTSPDLRLFQFMCAHVTYLLENRGITFLLFSEAAHMNDADLKRHLHDILIQQKQYVSKIIQDGIVSGLWDPELNTESVALLYLGIPLTLNIELVLNPEGVKRENFCKQMCDLLKRVLQTKP